MEAVDGSSRVSGSWIWQLSSQRCAKEQIQLYWDEFKSLLKVSTFLLLLVLRSKWQTKYIDLSVYRSREDVGRLVADRASTDKVNVGCVNMSEMMVAEQPSVEWTPASRSP